MINHFLKSLGLVGLIVSLTACAVSGGHQSYKASSATASSRQQKENKGITGDEVVQFAAGTGAGIPLGVVLAILSLGILA